MDRQDNPVTNLGPNSGGRAPGGPSARVYHWEWGPDDARRPGLPWIGIFLLVFGGLLLLQQVNPNARAAGSLIVLAVGPRLPDQVGRRSRDRVALRRRHHHRARCAGRAQFGRRRRRWPRHVLLRRRIPVHRAGPVRHRRRLGLAALVRRPPCPPRWRQHDRARSVGGLIVPVTLIAIGVVILMRGAARRTS